MAGSQRRGCFSSPACFNNARNQISRLRFAAVFLANDAHQRSPGEIRPKLREMFKKRKTGTSKRGRHSVIATTASFTARGPTTCDTTMRAPLCLFLDPTATRGRGNTNEYAQLGECTCVCLLCTHNARQYRLGDYKRRRLKEKPPGIFPRLRELQIVAGKLSYLGLEETTGRRENAAATRFGETPCDQFCNI